MEPENSGQNVDGIKPGDGQAPVSNVDGFVTNPKPSTIGSDISLGNEAPQASLQQNTPPPQVTTPSIPPKAKKFNTLTIVFLILFILSFMASGYFYMQSSSAKSDLKTEQSKSASTSSQQSADKAKIDSLTAENKAQTETIASLNKYITDLTKITVQLKTTCGAACKNVVIPPAPTPVPTPTP